MMGRYWSGERGVWVERCEFSEPIWRYTAHRYFYNFTLQKKHYINRLLVTGHVTDVTA